MDFVYVIEFNSTDGRVITRTGTGVFYPTDMRAFRLEDQLWAICEEYGVRPDDVNIHISFKGELNGQPEPKYIEDTKAETPGT